MNWNRIIRVLAGAAALVGVASMPVAAQVAPPAAPGIPSNPSPIGDTSAIAREAQGWLADLVRINTTNPPGNEQMAAMYIAGILNKEGIKPEILEVTPGRSAVVARLRSGVMADPSKALLLVAHVDVVGVDKSKWTVDPFGAVMKDGYLYGRGAIDDKGMLAANLAGFIALKRANVRLNRDVIFLATADEEQGGDASIKILIAKHWDKFAAGFALNESPCERRRNCPRDVGACLEAHEGQRGGSSGLGDSENRRLLRAGALHHDCAAIFRTACGHRRR